MCDTAVAVGKATASGHVIFAKNSDRNPNECQPLHHSPRRTHAPGTAVHCQYIEIRESGIRLRPLTIRYVPPAELDAMAAAAELRLVERSSDWNGTPFAEGDVARVSLYAPH